MNRSELASFTTQAAHMVARNDRTARRRALWREVRGSVGRASLVWSALVVAAVVLWLLPMNMRVA